MQQKIEEALSEVFKVPIRINYAGRTDAGVHAFGQTVDFSPTFFIDTLSLKEALNSILPPDIRVRRIMKVSDDFHSRYSAKFREYMYFVYTGDSLTPFLRNYVWHKRSYIDIQRMKSVVGLFVGKKDFRFVANEVGGKDCIREVYFLRIKKIRKFVIFHIRANAFLRGMVRNIVGILMGFGLNRLQMDQSGNIIFRSGALGSLKAPARGLFLRKVGY